MATITSLVDRVRQELGDTPKSFVTQFVAEGITNRYRLNYSPVDAENVLVFKNNVDITSTAEVEETTGIVVLDDVPSQGDEFTITGNYFRYFTTAEVTTMVENALLQHVGTRTDTFGRTITVENLPGIEEYPVALYATTLALYTLATDASFDINIFAPDGVTIPRSERYRQLMEMIDARREQYRELCVQLGIGMYQIEVFNLRRISKMTNRYVPVYRPMEVDDKSFPLRVDLPLPSYGDRKEPWPSDAEELTAYEGFEFTYTKTFSGYYSGKVFQANLLTQRGSTYTVRDLNLVITNDKLVNITDVDRTLGSTTATITVDEAHGMVTGDQVFINGINDEFNGTWTVVAAPTATSFTVTTTETTAVALSDQTGTADPYGLKNYTATMSLTAEQTRRLARRTYWSLAYKDALVENAEITELYGGGFFTERASEAVL